MVKYTRLFSGAVYIYTKGDFMNDLNNERYMFLSKDIAQKFCTRRLGCHNQKFVSYVKSAFEEITGTKSDEVE